VEVRSCTMRPTFFPYDLEHVSGSVRYARGHVHLADIRARHGRTAIGLKSGLLQLKPEGGFLAWLNGLRGQDVVPDATFRQALPDALRRGLERLRLEGPLEVETSLTVDVPPPPSGQAKIWWEGGLRLRDAKMRLGVRADEVTGRLSCRGYHDGH